ncbi:uncharacterized protein UV8b_03185 [Ustilaginoidea virens]|uniref:Protein BIG1 n=1 Tax=Ustilaginoidea virens TaxID=1159556 RepID=A0A8E5HPX7_USTVR|nr:uncharacterized protein UV8b_03185 [Ustilaginoidea virens]QUC18944.1 hypothetical protein UV8b_03185 [Ustilaginoidea virens]
MIPQSLASALALSGAAFAFSDSSPWVLLSTSEMPRQPNANQLQTSSEVAKFTKDFLGGCPTDRYLIVTQPGLRATDLGQADGCSMPHLCRIVQDAHVKGQYSVAEVVGDVTGARYTEHIRAACSEKGKVASVIQVPLEPLSPDSRAQILGRNDDALSKELDATTLGNSYTILLYAPPREPLYDSEFLQPLHLDMKRGVDDAPVPRANDTQRDTRPLFEKYQFFTPGIFMGIIVALVLLSILGAGIRGLASLEVSYGAFDKEMGPAAQKKQQ